MGVYIKDSAGRSSTQGKGQEWGSRSFSPYSGNGVFLRPALVEQAGFPGVGMVGKGIDQMAFPQQRQFYQCFTNGANLSRGWTSAVIEFPLGRWILSVVKRRFAPQSSPVSILGFSDARFHLPACRIQPLEASGREIQSIAGNKSAEVLTCHPPLG